MALRGLCSLRFAGMVEYTAPLVIKKLDDEDPYVRKTAINCCIKLYYVEKSFVEKHDIITTLYEKI